VASRRGGLQHYSALIVKHRAELERLGVTGAAIAGSIARGDFGASSDVDIVVDFDPNVVRTTFALARIKRALEGWLGRDVDIVSRRALELPKHRRMLDEARIVF
jgi:predicted nucleotidyltransferase